MVSRRGWLAGAGALLLVREALAQGRIEKGVVRARGEVRVNGATAAPGTTLRAGDVVATGKSAELVFVIGRDAMLVRGDSRVEIDGKPGSLIASGLRILTGAVLSVFSPGEMRQIRAPTASIGIRGTGIYVEAQAARTYVCTCYGIADLQASDDPAARETVRTMYHDQPRYVMAKGAPQMIMQAPVVNHTDAELILLESLVDRHPPFVGKPYRPY